MISFFILKKENLLKNLCLYTYVKVLNVILLLIYYLNMKYKIKNLLKNDKKYYIIVKYTKAIVLYNFICEVIECLM